MNSQMRRIDLVCKLGGPLIIALLSGYSNQVAIASNFTMNCLVVGYEYYAIAKVYQTVPALQEPKLHIRKTVSDSHRTYCFTAWLQDAKSYFTHSVCLPSFSYSLVYFTVLSFSGRMITYLLAIGFTSTSIGLMRTVSVAVEITATWAAPLLISRIGPIRSGSWFVNWQLMCLISAGAFLFYASSATISTAGLVVGTILSRIGLWGFDLSTQILVQNVSNSHQLTGKCSYQHGRRKFKQASEGLSRHRKLNGRISLRCSPMFRP